jgi:hypothetical protein
MIIALALTYPEVVNVEWKKREPKWRYETQLP